MTKFLYAWNRNVYLDLTLKEEHFWYGVTDELVEQNKSDEGLSDVGTLSTDFESGISKEM